MKDKKRIRILEKKIRHQKDRITQLEQIAKERNFLLNSKKNEAFSDIVELYNNIEDDLEMDKTGENGYATDKEVVQAINKYTLKVLKRKYKKWKKLTRK